jgi:hypothetical protein
MIKRLEQACEEFPDLRTGKNNVYELVDVGMSAFSVFFTQSPSFLAHQRDMKLRKGRCNAETLFDLSELPSDNQIRNLLVELTRYDGQWYAWQKGVKNAKKSSPLSSGISPANGRAGASGSHAE